MRLTCRPSAGFFCGLRRPSDTETKSSARRSVRGWPPVAGRQNRSIPRHPSRSRQLMQIAFTLYMIVLFPDGAPVVTNVRDVAKSVRLWNRSGRRIRAQKYPGGAGSFNLIRVRPQVRLRDAGDATSALSALRCSAVGPPGALVVRVVARAERHPLR
jgi:hypothetical protein